MVDLSIQSRSHFKGALNDVLGGAAASVLTVTFGLSYSLLIFAGPLSPYLSYGVATTFITSAILAAVLALRSSFPFAIAGPETSTAAMTGILASSLVEHMGAHDPSAPILGVNGKLDDQAPVDDIYLLMEHGRPKSARIYANGHHMGRTPGEPSEHITATIVEWLKERLT